MIQLDKWLHFAVGFGCTVLGEFLGSADAGMVFGTWAGWAKEKLYDKKRPRFHTVDGWDAYATAAGAVVARGLLAASTAFGL